MSSRWIADYADAFNQRFTGGPGVSSPLGAWLLLALVAPRATGEQRARLEQVIGADADRAARFASALLAQAPDEVRAAVAVWGDVVGLVPDDAAVERGPVPDQATADAWTSRATDGLIERFPVDVPPDAVALLTSALATRISWRTPLDTDPDGHLVLRAGRGWQAVVRTEAAGLVAVARPHVPGGLTVMSVAAGAEVPAEAVHRAAHEIGVTSTSTDVVVPTQDGPAWTVTESRQQRASWTDVVDDYTSRLPAWSASSRHEITDAPGVRDALDVIGSLLPASAAPLRSDAVQAAVAAYTATGFEAAAVTTMMRAGSAAPPVREVLVREVRLDFVRPHAVLALTDERVPHVGWHRMPVFSAWVDPADD